MYLSNQYLYEYRKYVQKYSEDFLQQITILFLFPSNCFTILAIFHQELWHYQHQICFQITDFILLLFFRRLTSDSLKMINNYFKIFYYYSIKPQEITINDTKNF